MNKLIDKAANIPVADAVPVVSVAPVTLAAPGRGIDLELRVSAPVTGDRLPVIVLSHGHGPSLYIPSLDGYGPVAHFWAAHGFVVIQPTHLNAKIYALGPDAPGAPLFWRSRVEDMSMIVDRLDEIEAEGFEPDGWSFEVGLVDQSNLNNNAMQQKCKANMFLKNISQRWRRQGDLARRRTTGLMRMKRSMQSSFPFIGDSLHLMGN